MNEKKYCEKRLKRIYPDYNKEYITFLANMILLSIYTSELNKEVDIFNKKYKGK